MTVGKKNRWVRNTNAEIRIEEESGKVNCRGRREAVNIIIATSSLRVCVCVTSGVLAYRSVVLSCVSTCIGVCVFVLQDLCC